MAFCTSCGPTLEENQRTDDKDGALMMLESVFKGQHDKQAISVMMDSVLTRYNVELSKENYLKIGNLLVAKRMESEDKLLEMDMLAHMNTINAGGRGVTFEAQLNKTVRAMELRAKQMDESNSQ